MVKPRELRRVELVPRGGEVRHPAPLGALALAAGAALGLLAAVLTNAWVGAAVAAFTCALIATGHGALLGALLGGALGAAGVAASTLLTRWSRGEVDAFISAGLDLYRIPLLTLLGAAVGWAGDFVRRALPPAGRLAARAAGAWSSRGPWWWSSG